MMFTILFGLSMDYEVFLLSRIREEWRRHGGQFVLVADGLAKTARVITAAAAIMICVVRVVCHRRPTASPEGVRPRSGRVDPHRCQPRAPCPGSFEHGRKFKVIFLAVFLSLVGMAGAGAFVLFIEIADCRLRTPADVRRVTRLPTLAVASDFGRMSCDETRDLGLSYLDGLARQTESVH